MKKENKICLFTMFISLIILIISQNIKNDFFKLILAIIGISLIIISIVFERKAKNPKIKHLGIFHLVRKGKNRGNGKTNRYKSK